ncbi:MAG: M56 family metallopeptidase [Planctomycetota bacterium]|jgi:beta-lactamase regulating signal transducer with metallopeptidase domain
MPWLLEATLSNAVIATAMALAVVAMARFLRHRPAVVHVMWVIVLLKLVTPPLVSVPVKFGWEARPASPGSAVEFPGEVPMGTIEALSESDVAALTTELERMRAARELQSTTASELWLAVLILWLVATVVWTLFAAVRIARFSWLLRAARPCGHDVAAVASRTARRLGLRKTPAIVIVDARIPPLVWHAGRAARIVLPSDFVSKWNREQLELLLAHELAHVKRGDHLVRWFTLAVLAVCWWHPVAWWAVRRLRVAEEQCCDAMVVAASPSRAHDYAETLLETLDVLAARRSPPPVLASGIGSGGSLKRRCEMIVGGQTKFRTGRIAGVLLLLAAIAVLPLAGVVRADDKSDKKSFDERLRRLEQIVESLVRQKGVGRATAVRHEMGPGGMGYGMGKVTAVRHETGPGGMGYGMARQVKGPVGMGSGTGRQVKGAGASAMAQQVKGPVGMGGGTGRQVKGPDAGAQQGMGDVTRGRRVKGPDAGAQQGMEDVTRGRRVKGAGAGAMPQQAKGPGGAGSGARRQAKGTGAGVMAQPGGYAAATPGPAASTGLAASRQDAAKNLPTVLMLFSKEVPGAAIERIQIRPSPENRPGSLAFVLDVHFVQTEKDLDWASVLTLLSNWGKAVNARGVNMTLVQLTTLTGRDNRVNLEIAFTLQ